MVEWVAPEAVAVAGAWVVATDVGGAEYGVTDDAGAVGSGLGVVAAAVSVGGDE